MQEELVAWVKRSWKPLAAGAVIVFVIIGGLIWYAVSGIGRKNTQVLSTSPSGATTTQDGADQAKQKPRALDGVLVDPSATQLSRFAVMIDNHPDAKPQSGLAEASLVYEIPVEGGLTRFMAVFDASSTVQQIGPVRSARLYFEEFARGLGAVYAHVGGSPEALEKAKTWKDFKDVNEFYAGSSFWRGKARVAPHNVYTKIELLRDLEQKKKWDAGSFISWKYTTESAASNTKAVPVPVISYPAELPITWIYEASSGRYTRKDGKISKKDLEGKMIQAANVVLLETTGQTIDDYGRLAVRTTGKGPVTVYRQGRELKGLWKRVDGEHIRFETVDGADLFLQPGPTWIQVVLPGMVSATTSASVQ